PMVLLFGGPDEAIEGDAEALVHLLEAPGIAGRKFARREPLVLRGLNHLQPVLVGTGQEEHVLAVEPRKARQRIGCDRLIGVADMWLTVRIGDRGRDVEDVFARWGRRNGNGSGLGDGLLGLRFGSPGLCSLYLRSLGLGRLGLRSVGFRSRLLRSFLGRSFFSRLFCYFPGSLLPGLLPGFPVLDFFGLLHDTFFRRRLGGTLGSLLGLFLLRRLLGHSEILMVQLERNLRDRRSERRLPCCF